MPRRACRVSCRCWVPDSPGRAARRDAAQPRRRLSGEAYQVRRPAAAVGIGDIRPAVRGKMRKRATATIVFGEPSRRPGVIGLESVAPAPPTANAAWSGNPAAAPCWPHLQRFAYDPFKSYAP